MTTMKKSLNPKQERFVQEYLVDLNATQAAIRAGYSPRTAESQGSRLLSNAKVAEAVQKEKEARAERLQLTQDDVLKELVALCTSNVNHYQLGLPEAGEKTVELADGSPLGAMSAVASVKRRSNIDEKGNTHAEVELKLWNKPTALTLAIRHFGMFNDKLRLDATEELKRMIVDAANGFDDKLAGLARRRSESERAS